MVDLVAQFTQSVPPVTRVCLLISFALMALVSLDILSPYNLFYSPRRVFQEFELWRILTSVFFFGDFSIHFFWSCYMLILYGSKLEEESFRGRTADFVWMLTLLILSIVAVSSFLPKSLFLSGALINSLTYIWGRKNPFSHVTILFFSVQAPFLPWVLAGLSAIIRYRILDHIVGIIVGHIFFYFDDIFPLLPVSRGFKPMQSPVNRFVPYFKNLLLTHNHHTD